jgi:Fe-S oxidoreductase
MQPLVMALLLAVGWGLFAFRLARRLRGLAELAASGGASSTPLWRRVQRAWRALHAEPLPGIAHSLVALAFVVLSARTLVLWSRGFVADFQLSWLIGAALADAYTFCKDLAVAAALGGVLMFALLRLVRWRGRLALTLEAGSILALIAALMLSELMYDGAHRALGTSALGTPLRWAAYPDPVGSLASLAFAGTSDGALRLLQDVGFWAHVSLVLVFLNLLVGSKHLHVFTALPNLLWGAAEPGRLSAPAASSEALLASLDRALAAGDPSAVPLGIGRVTQLTRKSGLDRFACTECGRCTSHCPASRTGKVLDPMRLGLALRGELVRLSARELVPDVIAPTAVWDCTTCRACEEACPVGISYVEEIVGLRRNLVSVRGEHFPAELQRVFENLETQGNPWGRSRLDRLAWAEGLGVPTFAERPSAEVLFWVGCAAAFDPQARSTARACVRLLQAAGVDFAVLGEEETCTGDVARRAGHEALFLQLAEANISTINGYVAQGGARRIITACPHCWNTLAREYPDFGGTWSVIPAVRLFAELVHTGRLTPAAALADGPERWVFHDPCYLGRHGGEYDSARALLARVPQLELVEASGHTRERATCCGAGGAHAFFEESGGQRVSQKRVLELAESGATRIASACPFCKPMLSDAAASLDRPESVTDVIEVLARACGVADSA